MRRLLAPRAATRLLIAVPLLLTEACGEAVIEPAVPSPVAESAPSPAVGQPGVELVLAADRRDPAPLLLALQADVRHRRAAAWLLARFAHEDALAPLTRALSDEDPTVRAYAATALGTFPALPAPIQERLLAALAAEEAPSPRAAMLMTLAALAPTIAAPALEHALARGTDAEQVASCRALGQHPDAWSDQLAAPVLAAVGGAASRDVREACWFALGRAPREVLPTNATQTVALHAVADPDPELRAGATRVLGRLESSAESQAALVNLAQDSEWRVAVHALRALEQSRPNDALLVSTLEAVLSHAWPANTPPPSAGPLHVLLTALDIASPAARSASVQAFAVALHARLSRPFEPATRDNGLLHCAAARLVDIGRGWPSRVDSCGLEQVSETDRAVLVADILAHAEGASAQRAAFLRRLMRSDTPRVRQAVLNACSSLPATDALGWALEGMNDPDIGVVISAMELATQLTQQARQAQDAAALQATLEGRPLAQAPLLPALPPALAALAPRLRAENHLEALVVFHHLVLALARPEHAEALAPLLASQHSHPVAAVRTSAHEAEIALGGGLAEDHEEPDIAQEPLAAALQLDARVLHLSTARGAITIALHPELAPTTVTRIAQLADDGFYDGLTFHRVVPGFVVQGGDPRGDGYGDAGWSQRCENPSMPYGRGVVGMALAGRDTGGSQFFVTTGPAHHLDGQYTAFGEVIEGMDAVDALQAGDAILHISVERGALSPPFPPAVLE